MCLTAPFDLVECDEAGGDAGYGLVDVGLSLVADRQASDAVALSVCALNGLLANYKFCLTPAAQLRLSWCLGPFPAATRSQVSGEIIGRGSAFRASYRGTSKAAACKSRTILA